jgi:hypothetical protein
LGEILSTIDLMMQRTKGMSLSPEEKKDLHLEELRKKAKGFQLRLVEHPASGDETIASIDKENEDDAHTIKSLIWNDMVNNMPHGHELRKHLDILAKLPMAKKKSQLLDELRANLNSATKNRSKDLKNIANAERKKLAAFGISGSAVVPKVSADAWLEDNMSAIIDSYKDKLLYNLA